MKVSEYHKKGLRNFVENVPSEYELLGESQEGAHKIKCFVKIENDKITDAKFNSSKRCKKLMAIADFICEKIKGQNINSIKINDKEVLEFFKEEKEKDKMGNRLNIVKKALGV